MKKLPIFTILILLVLIAAPRRVSAHGEGGILRMSDRAIGSYLLYAWTSPGVPRVGEAHLEALIMTPDGTPVDGCEVRIEIEPAGRDENNAAASAEPRQIIQASDALAVNQFRHEGIASIRTPGHYKVNIVVLEEGLEIGQSSFTMEVLPVPQWITWGLNSLMVGLVACGVWFGHKGIQLVRKTDGLPNCA